ncbi:MAG: thioredoxin domain-containing protein [Sporichthyaceae bacterium]
MSNRLADATSPYLIGHRDDPVDWWPWSPEAFAEARRRNVPMLISIGYAASRWCRLMAAESFRDPATASIVNAKFVSVLVDREERPDVDAVYLEATQAATGRGGWPMTVFATAAGEPFRCGTYFPARAEPGRPAFRAVLEEVALEWAKDRLGLENEAMLRVAELADGSRLATLGEAPDEALLARVLTVLCAHEDTRHGGFGGTPKFPLSGTLMFLLRHYARTGARTALGLAERACEAMARGGVYDQLAGGFARYAVDQAWAVPQLEKTLYDNALLLRVYAAWWKVAGSDLGRRIANETADWMLRDLWTPRGGFASTLADTEAYYLWTRDQILEALGGSDGSWAALCAGVTATGTFGPGLSVPRRRFEPDDPDRWAAARDSLLAVRSRREGAMREEKVVAAWNGLAITALVEAGEALGRPALVQAAAATARCIADLHTVAAADGDRLLRSSWDGRCAPHQGVLEDYGDVAEGFLALHAVTGEGEWVDRAGRLLATVLAQFSDGYGGFYDTAADAEELVLRPRDWADTPTPSGSSAVAAALAGYAAATGSAVHRRAAEAALATTAAKAVKAATGVGWGLAVAESLLADPPRN